MKKSPDRAHFPACLWVVCVVTLLLAACTPPGAANVATQRTATIMRGTLTSSVNATGNIQPEATVRLSFNQPGTVAQVLAQTSDVVKQGDVLALLDTTDLELSIAQARAALESATAAYNRTLEGPRQADIDAAQAALNAAYANYSKVQAGPQSDDYSDITAGLQNAEAVLKQAQMAYDQAQRVNPAGINGSPAAAALEQATNAYTIARARYDKARTPADRAQLAAAAQQIENARSNLDKLKQPVKTFDIEQAQAQISQAQIQLDQAKSKLAQARLLAPRDGVITAVNVKVGELVSTQPVMTLVDLSKLHINITVDEIDIARIKPGQEVLITLDALPDTELKGSIDRIAPTSTNVSGVVTYEVRVILAKTDVTLRSGMTANTSVVLERRENALLAPNWAVRRDKPTGKTFVTTKVDDKTIKEVEVTIGLRNETVSEIISGLTEGQVILAPQTSSLMSQ
ncbi:MAG TPA: efflux RND transporter periplasmic adaptor subunit [Anaerolineae bacterium]|jgi:HlyD family secretion protein